MSNRDGQRATPQGPARTKDECLRAAAHVVLLAAIRIEQERLDAGLPPLSPPRESEG